MAADTQAPARGGWQDRLPWLCALALAVAFMVLAHRFALCELIGNIRDDAIYSLAAHSLAHGEGLIDPTTPAKPMMMRYPPGFPAFLSLLLHGDLDVNAEAMRLLWVTPVLGAVFIFSCFGYFVRRGRLGPWWSLGLAFGLVLHPILLRSASLVMADTPYALVTLWAVWAVEVAVERQAGIPAWLGAGLLVGASYLVRSAGLALVASTAVLLGWWQRWRAFGAFGVGAAIAIAPWLVYNHTSNANNYADAWFTNLVGQANLLPVILGSVLLATFGSALPSIWSATLFIGMRAYSGFYVALAAAIVMLPARGMWVRARSGAPADKIAPAFVAVSLFICVVYGLAFAFYAEDFLQRAFIPLMPFLLLFSVEGGRAFVANLSADVRSGLAVAALIAYVGGNAPLAFRFIAFPPQLFTAQADIAELFDYIRAHTPQDAVLMGPYAHMTTLYTRRYCVQSLEYLSVGTFAPRIESPSQMLVQMRDEHVSYFVGIPRFNDNDPNDWTVLQLNALRAKAPGVVHIVYMNKSRSAALFAVDTQRLKQVLDTLPKPKPGADPHAMMDAPATP